MGQTADAVIIGAGLNGAATAYFLLQRGFRRIAIIDADKPASGASGAAVGLLRTHYDNRPETELAAKSMPYFRNWPEHFGDHCGWRATGFFRFVEAEERDNMHRNVAFQREFGEKVEILSADDVRRIAPAFKTDDIGAAIYEPDSGVASNSRATFSLLKRACAKGATLEPYTKAIAIRIEGNRVAGVVTNRHEIATPIVVLAAGASCKELASSCGVDVPLEARPIRVAEILPPAGFRVPGCYMDPMSDSWISPREQGRALISAPHPKATTIDPENEAADFSHSDAAAGLAPVNRRLPGIDAATIVRWWTRPDCYAPDGKPVIGATEMDGLFLNTASAGKGHKTAPAAGLALSELIADGGTKTADLQPFGLARFRNGPSPWSESEYRKRVIG